MSFIKRIQGHYALATTNYKGVVKWYNQKREIGYISCPELPAKEISFDLSDLVDQRDEHNLIEGAKVAFEIKKTEAKSGISAFEQAVKIELL